ncbi:extracellular solute-binding protein [Mycobacterium sp. CBMA247]|nr:extracellular solute-binding protein [Mycolicibacterium sp. CBMA 329]MUL88041.1 extracellular solute-binding protein [Mycolicibacterium sp. CBMA 331]MUM02372.1 extracellular solute-binding protein [Mycolicibacterium sp. CBMA 334]MUM29126.1 extracellular solute-binding protein [Mycolicibacterium sp. CBMA 295]MUM38338.1 extracellular solute-binding protein [Mycolicibacterium sp. CBMA 247]MUM44106.1 extracellular solute-binding protein [Mycolicibacterium sp. CBMA 294]
MGKTRITVAALLTSVMLVLTGCAGMGSAPTGSDVSADGPFDWKRFSGTEIDVMLDQHPWTQGVQTKLADFESATGIKVNLQTYAEDLYFDKLDQAVRTSNSPDVVMTGFDTNLATLEAANLLAPLTPLIENPALTTADYDLSDFPSGIKQPAMLPSGDPNASLYGIPISTETYMLFYNKDLVAKYLGGKVPTTMTDLIAAAKLITAEGHGDVYGSVVRGIRATSIVDTPTALVFNRWPATNPAINLPYNVYFDGAWNKPRLPDRAITQGLSDYAQLIAAGPPNKFALDWPDASALFSQGKAAFYLDASVFGPNFEKPDQSTVVGKVGYSTLPAAAQGGTSGSWSWGLSIPSASTKKGAAWLFTQWFTDKQRTAEIGALTGGAPRQSSAEAPTYKAAFTPEYSRAVADSLANTRPTAVIKEDADPVLLIIVDAVMSMAQGQDPFAVMANAQTKMAALYR